MHGPNLSGHWYPARRAAATADPYDSPMNGPFHVADSLLLFGQPIAQPSQGVPPCVPTQKNAAHPCQQGHGFTTIPGKSECLIHSCSRYNRLSAHSSWISAVARDLQEHRGKSLVVAGDMQPEAVHKCRGAHSEEHHFPPYARSTMFRPRARPRRWVACRE